MTEVEAVTLAQSLFSNASNMYVIFLTLLSGYLLVAHLAGKSLTRGQLIIITALYIPSMAYTLYAWGSFMQAALHYTGIAAKLRGDFDYGDQPLTLVFGVVVNAAIALAPLKYMLDIRRPNAP